MNDDLIKKYDTNTNPFVASEEELKIIQNSSQSFLSNEKIENDSQIIEFQPSSVVEPPKNSDDLNTDYNYIRTNLYTITERSIEALNNLVQIADQSQHPRAYEVVALLVNTISGAQKDLMSIHKDKHKLTGEIQKNSPEVVNNNLFVGNTAQLDEIISKMTKKSIDNE